MEKSELKRNIENRLVNFAVMIVGVVKNLPDDRIGNHLGGNSFVLGLPPV